MATPTPTDATYVEPVRFDIHHTVTTPAGTVRHPGRAAYCHRCNPDPVAAPAIPVPAARRTDYVPPVITTQLATRETLSALADAGPHRAPTGDPIPDGDIHRGMTVLFQVGRHTWHVGVVESTTRGAGRPRVAYVHPGELATARAEKYPTNVRRTKPKVMYPYPAEESAR